MICEMMKVDLRECMRMGGGECMGAQVIEKQWGIVEDSDRDDKRQVGRRGAGKGHPFSLPDNTYIAAQNCL